MGEREIKVQLIGNYLRPLVKPLKEYGIICGETGSVIDGCSILAMEDEPNTEIQYKYIFSPPYDKDIFFIGPIMNLQKNLSVRLSRDPEIYRRCIRFDAKNKSDRIRNDSEYVIIFNSSMGYTLYEKDGMVFSETWTHNRFINDIKSDGSYRKSSFPFPDYFNWKYYYDKFIDVILQEYDNRHIILIRMNSASWFVNKKEISAFEEKSSKWRNRIEEMDEYFIEKTNCLSIDELYNYIPQQRNPCAFVYGCPGQLVYSSLAGRIAEAIRMSARQESAIAVKYGNPFAKYLCYRLSSDVLAMYVEKLEYIEENWLSLNTVCRRDWQSGDHFLQNIVKLQAFLNPKDRRTLSDFVVESPGNKAELVANADLDAVEIYTRYMKLNINDLIAVYMLCARYRDKRPFRRIVSNILENTDALPVKKAIRFVEHNLNFLKDYPYIQPELVGGVVRKDILYVELGNNLYLVLDAKADSPIKKIELAAHRETDIEQIFNNGLSCDIFSANTLCADHEFYMERARRKLLGKPITVHFESAEAFEDSLNYIDYSDLLNSEKYVISLSDESFCPALEDYAPIVDIGTMADNGIDFAPLDMEECNVESINHLWAMGKLLDSALDRDSGCQQVRLSRKLTDSLLKNSDALKKNRFKMSMKGLAAGFAIADQCLSTDKGIYYFIKNMHLGDNVRGATLLALFRDYHTRNKTFPIQKVVVVTTPNNKDLMAAYRGVDEVITFTKEELSYLQEYAASGVCIHNLYSDTYRLVKSWGTPNLCDIYKIPEEYLRQTPEVLRFPDKMTDISMANARKFLEKQGISAEKTVVIMPYAQSSGSLAPDMLINIIRYFNRIGYTVFTNMGLGEEVLENTLPLTETPDIVFAMASMGAIMIGIQSGIMDALEWFDINIKFIFVSVLDARENIRCFYNKAKIIVSPPHPHSLSQRIERRKGAVSIGVSTEEERMRFVDDVISLSKVYIKGNLQNSIHPLSDEIIIHSQNNLNDYIAEAVKMSDIVIFISVCDSADRYWNAFESRHLLGLKKDLSEALRLSYLAVIDAGSDVCTELLSNKWDGVNYNYSFKDVQNSELAGEIYSDEIERQYGEMPFENYCWIYSCAMDSQTYTKSRIIINGIDYSLNKRGLNIVLYSKKRAKVIDSITVDAYADATLSVKRTADIKDE